MEFKLYDFFWAKKRESNGRYYWLPLIQHLEDTKNIAGLLWEHWLGEGQKKLITSSIVSESQIDNVGKCLIQFLAATHDLGKATPVFQTKKGYANSEDLDVQLLEKLERIGFEKVSSLQLTHSAKSHHSVAGQYLLSTYGVHEDLATIVGGHHGKPIDTVDDYKNQKFYESSYFQTEIRSNSIYNKWHSTQRELFQWALKSSGFTSVQDLPKIKQPAQVILSGLLIMADWIASNEEFFPLIPIDENQVSDKVSRLENGFLKWKKYSGLWEPTVKYTQTVFDNRFGFKPREIQAILSEIIIHSQEPGIFILEAPMGIGKTEAALVAAEQLAAKTGRNGLFFGLPTQATSNGIFPRIEKWLENVSSEFGDNLSIHLVHGKSALNEDFLDLPRSSNINMDDVENGSVIVNEWFSGRKTSALDDFVVGTVDQLLMVALKQKHLALRHLGFSKKVVVIDEVHAYDTYMNQYLLEAIKWLGAYGIPVIILSATLPSDRRIELIKNYLEGRGRKFDKTAELSLSGEFGSESYPLITYSDGLDVHQKFDFKKEDNRKIGVFRLQEENLLKTIEEQLLEGGIVGIIVNTVKRAQELAQLLSGKFSDEDVEILHSGFIATERIRKEQELLQMIGKGAKRPYKKIIIGTQVIEQSLDIDFDVLISDLAPMDLLIQRIGRLHRHDIERPKKHKLPQFFVLGTNENLEFESGASVVYGDYLLARTQYFLSDKINIPSDISTLVQKVYNQKLEIEFDNKAVNDSYNISKKDHYTKLDIKKQKAKTYRIADPVLRGSRFRKENLIGWLKHSNPDDSEEQSYAQVRDIEETIEVIALKKKGCGYGLFGQEQDISDLISDYKTAKEVAKNTLRLPKSFSKSYNIDKTIEELEQYNTNKLTGWRSSSWLRGSLGIIFDENNEFTINGRKIHYDEKYGVSIKEVEKGE